MGKAKPVYNWDPKTLNDLTFQYFYNLLKGLAISSIKWHNMPKEIDERFLELTLFETGMAVFFKDEIADLYVAMTTQIGGNLDVYRIPHDRVAYSVNNYRVFLNSKNSVLIFNNMLHLNDVSVAQIYAIKLMEIDRAIQVNANAQKTPIILRTTPEQQLTIKNIANDFTGNTPAMIVDKNIGLNPIESINTGAPFVASDLQFLKSQILSEALSYFGIESNPQSKKERSLTDEVENSLGITIGNRYNRLKARQQACDIINEMFGLDIYVTFESDFVAGQSGETTDTEVLNEQVYD